MDADHAHDALARYESHTARTLQDLAHETRHLDAGWAIRTPELPWVWTLNQLCLTGPVDADGVVPLAEAVQADQPYRHVVVRYAPTADAAEPVLTALGW